MSISNQRAVSWIVAAPCLSIAALATPVGLWDLATADRSLERVFGLLLFLGGAALLAGPLEVRRTGRTKRAARFFGYGILPGGLCAVVQYGATATSGKLWPLWIYGILVPAICCLWSFKATPNSASDPSAAGDAALRKMPVELTATLLAAVLAAGATVLAGFLDEAEEPQVLEVNVDLSVLGYREHAQTGKVAVVEVKITMQNDSSERIMFVSGLYNARGLMSSSKSTIDTDVVPKDFGVEISSQGWSGRHETPWRASLIEAGQDLVATGNFLDPGQESTITFPVIIPLLTANTLAVNVDIATALADRLQLGDELDSYDKGELISDFRPARVAWEIDPTSYLNKRIAGDNVLSVEYGIAYYDAFGREADRPNQPQSDVGAWLYSEVRAGSYARRNKADGLSVEAMENLYGLYWSSATATTTIDLGSGEDISRTASED